MSTQNENLLVTLIKKSVGLPTGKSDCCGSTAGASSDCCGTETSDASQSSGCGCGNDDCGGVCCGAEEEKQSESSPAIGSSAI
ncbi:hypothetical protein FBQ83_15790 [Chloroflexi bacterium CFX5]|nr:hypothetical protein [Anaerolineales bacterium]MDL1920764.1 hypothetical protein [Chloroflexi bacterium CFX5]NUQ60305.1 hypothetical protein [Anaerolineales bacterium]